VQFRTKCAVEKPKDENIFQNARRLLIAEFQNIIFTEFLPLVVGSGTMARFNLNLPTLHTGSTQYDRTTNPTTINGFQTAAMRFGHSMVQQVS
jgi:peroxidase